DADDVMAGLHRRRGAAPPDAPIRRASFIGLVLNRRGVERALDAGCDEVNAVVPVSDTFSERNQGTDTAGAIAVWEQVAELARGAGVPASVTLTTSFGCPYEGEVPLERLAEVVARCAAAGGDEIALADTIGVAVPTDVRARLEVAREELGRVGPGAAGWRGGAGGRGGGAGAGARVRRRGRGGGGGAGRKGGGVRGGAVGVRRRCEGLTASVKALVVGM